MILTLAWKELREHQGIWLTMVFMSVVLGLGLAKLVALGDSGLALGVATFTILGMTATYGVVCGAMMLAGEQEGGTLIFLDIFLGRRGLLWTGKLAIGAVLALSQALAVAVLLSWLQPESPTWIVGIVGQDVPMGGGRGVSPDARWWFLVLPVVALEAFFWGLLGSSLTQRVLTGAAVAAACFTPVLLMALCAPPYVFVVVRVVAVCGCLGFSFWNFLGLSQDPVREPQSSAQPDWENDRKEQFLKQWEHYERDEERSSERPVVNAPVSVPEPILPQGWSGEPSPGQGWSGEPSPVRGRLAHGATQEREKEIPDQPRSPLDALWWLTCQQAWPIVLSLAAAGLLIGLIIVPANFQIFWPLATLLLGVACGTAAFAPEQRDQSYQFLSAQHFPLQQIWRFKILFWLAVAVLVALILLVGTAFFTVVRQVESTGTFYGLLGPMLFLGVWLFYGFCTGQVFVWLCRKSILALLISTLVAMTALGLWLPSLVCGGMSGWQVWAPPLTMLLATWALMRAWASGRIWERKPLAALVGFGAATLVWALLVFGYRAWEVPDVGEPLDPIAFRDALPTQKDNAAGKALHQAIAKFGEPNDAWLAPLAEATQLPVGVLDLPRADGQAPVVTHLPTCRKMTDELLRRAKQREQAAGFEHLAQILALSRNLRNKASVESYLIGVELEEKALLGLDHWLTRGKPDPQLLRKVLDELNRHANETPTPLDCLQTECFRSGGVLTNPILWTFAERGGAGRIPEAWLANGIAVSLETPWEAERKTRIWQLVWAGHLRNIQTPHWQLPAPAAEPRTEKLATHDIVQDWLPAADGQGVTRERTARLVDSSWLADERLFASVARLRNSATRARWRVDAARQTVGLGLFRLEEGKSARDLQDLVPKYLPTGLPTDPYSGESYRYRIEPQDEKEIVWSTGPDRIAHGGHKHGGRFPDDHAVWSREDFDLILAAPQWP